MKITLTISSEDTRQVESRGAHAIVEGSCPRCRAEPFVIAGSGKTIESHDTYAAHGVCLGCRQGVGVIRAQVSTIFGLEEDERVLHGIAKVY